MDTDLSTMSSLLKTDKCSPLIVYIVLVIVSVITIFNTNGELKKFQNFKVNNIFTMHLWQEIVLLILLGVILFGLCQYNQQTLAWVVLFFPLVFQMFKSLLVFNSVHVVQKLAPPDAPALLLVPADGPSVGRYPYPLEESTPDTVSDSVTILM